MIEKCGYCGLVHDVGDGMVKFGDQTIKTCPLLDPNTIVTITEKPEVKESASILDAEFIE